MSAPREHWRTKWRYVGLFWLAQAIIVHVALAVFMFDERLPRDWNELFERVVQANGFLFSAFAIVPAVCFQAVLLLPLRRPGIKQGSMGVRVLHAAIGATGVAIVSWYLLVPIAALLDLVGAQPGIQAIPGLAIAAGAWVVTFTWQCRKDGAPAWMSLGVAIACASLLAAGWVGAAHTAAVLFFGAHEDLSGWALLGGGVVGWIVATPLVISYCRRRRTETALSRIASVLFIGTAMETAAIIPLEVMIRRKTDCHCGTGSFWALTFCLGVGMVAAGPVVFLPAFSKRRRRWYAGRCEVCGYDMTGCMSADRCPECGAGWKPEPTEDC